MEPDKVRHVIPLATAEGVFTAWYSDRGLARLEFPPARNSDRRAVAALPEPFRTWHALTAKAVKRILHGRCPAAIPPLDFSSGTAFQRAVWLALRRIPRGRTRGYAEVAAAVGSPGAARAVGQACGANPIPLLVPCHRVLAAGGKLGGFSGGLDWKRRLLAGEHVQPPA